MKAEEESFMRRLIIECMTNWQRNQAGKACKGVWSKMSIERLEYFAQLKHWKST